MADFNKPTTTGSLYSGYSAEVRDLIADVAKMLDGTGTLNTPANAIRWSSTNNRFEKYVASVWQALTTKLLMDVDTVDGYHAGNGSGAVPISNGTVNTNLNADLLDGAHAGNGVGNVPLNNGSVNSTLNADLVDGYHAGNASGNIPISNGVMNTNLNAQYLGGNLASAFATSGHTHAGVYMPVSGGIFTGDITTHRGNNTGVLYLGSAQTSYLYYDGANYQMPNGGVYSNSFQATSMRALKQDIVPVRPGALARVLDWQITEFAYKRTPDERKVGVIADDVDRRIAQDGKHIDLYSALFELAAAVQELARRVH